MCVKDVMKLLDDNQGETESATTAVVEPEPSPLSKPQGQTQINTVPLFFSVGTPCWVKQNMFFEINSFFLHFFSCNCP